MVFLSQSHLPGRSEGMSARGSDEAGIRLVLRRGRRWGGEGAGLREGAGQGIILPFTLSWRLHKRFKVTVVEAHTAGIWQVLFSIRSSSFIFSGEGFSRC